MVLKYISTKFHHDAISVNEIVSALHERTNVGSVPTTVNTASYCIVVTFS